MRYHISSWQDLDKYGIQTLTGEACTIGARFLCDFNERGAKIWRTMLGLPHDAKLAEPWNGKSSIGDHVASALIPIDLFNALAVFCLFDAGCAHAIVTNRLGIYGVTEKKLDEPEGAWSTVAEFRKLYGDDCIVRTYTPLVGQPARGLSAVHAMSGRSA